MCNVLPVMASQQTSEKQKPLSILIYVTYLTCLKFKRNLTFI